MPQATLRFSGFLPQDFAFAYGQLSDFPDSYRRKLPLTTDKTPIFRILTVGKPLTTGQNPISPILTVEKATFSTGKTPVFRIPAVGNHQNLRYKTGISCFGRSEILIFAGQYAILLISAAEA